MDMMRSIAVATIAIMAIGCSATGWPQDSPSPIEVTPSPAPTPVPEDPSGECSQRNIICLRVMGVANLPIMWEEGEKYRVGLLHFTGVDGNGYAHYTLRGVAKFNSANQAAGALSRVKEAIE